MKEVAIREGDLTGEVVFDKWWLINKDKDFVALVGRGNPPMVTFCYDTKEEAIKVARVFGLFAIKVNKNRSPQLQIRQPS